MPHFGNLADASIVLSGSGQGPLLSVRAGAPSYRCPTRENIMSAGLPDQVSRRLAAILAADVAGYSQVMEASVTVS